MKKKRRDGKRNYQSDSIGIQVYNKKENYKQ
jgi:hypothetical protein